MLYWIFSTYRQHVAIWFAIPLLVAGIALPFVAAFTLGAPAQTAVLYQQNFGDDTNAATVADVDDVRARPEQRHHRERRRRSALRNGHGRRSAAYVT